MISTKIIQMISLGSNWPIPEDLKCTKYIKVFENLPFKNNIPNMQEQGDGGRHLIYIELNRENLKSHL